MYLDLAASAAVVEHYAPVAVVELLVVAAAVPFSAVLFDIVVAADTFAVALVVAAVANAVGTAVAEPVVVVDIVAAPWCVLLPVAEQTLVAWKEEPEPHASEKDFHTTASDASATA